MYSIYEQRRSVISRMPFGVLGKYLEGRIAMQQIELLKHTDKINELLARYGVKLWIISCHFEGWQTTRSTRSK